MGIRKTVIGKKAKPSRRALAKAVFVPGLDRICLGMAVRSEREAEKLAVPKPWSKIEVQIYQAQP